MKHTFTREQIKRIIIEELERSRDEEAAEELLKDLIGLKEDEFDEFEAKMERAKTFKKSLGLTSLFAAVAILFGGMSGLTSAEKDSIKSDIEKVEQVDSETLEKFGVDLEALKDPESAARTRGAAYPTAELGLADLSDLNNTQRIDAAWKQIDDMVASGELNYEKARVSSTLPGGMATLDYDAIPPNLVMPNSLSTKDKYRAWLVQNVLEGDIKNLPKLRDFVYGNTGKWPSGSGEDKARYAGKAQVLPPEWTVALDLYQETLTSVVDDMLTNYKNGDEEMRQYILQVNGVETPEQLDAVLNKLLYQAGLQSIELTDSP
jgi:hypothetical protein